MPSSTPESVSRDKPTPRPERPGSKDRGKVAEDVAPGREDVTGGPDPDQPGLKDDGDRERSSTARS